MKYIVFFRGINVGGHKKTPMAELKKMFSQMGFTKVNTFLNSGNVIFETEPLQESELHKKIDENFRKHFGFESKIMIRSEEQIQDLIALNPFQEIESHKDITLYVSFLPSKIEGKIGLPYEEKGFKILQKTAREVFSVVNVKIKPSVKAMSFLEKQFGPDLTTRNWNTVLKTAKL